MQTLRTQVPGATDAMLNIQVFNVVDEFLRRTNAWLEQYEIALEENLQEYPLAVPAGASVVRLMSVTHNDVPVPSAGSGIIQQSIGRLAPEQIFPDGDTSYEPSETDLTGGVFTYAIYEPDYITTSSAPDAEAIKFPMKVVMALSLGSTCLECDCGDWSIPEWMWDMYFQAWLDGTLSRFYGMPMKPWSNEKHAIIHGRKYRNRMAYHKQEIARGFSYGTPHWRFPRGGWV
jgi:hypothetical protein